RFEEAFDKVNNVLDGFQIRQRGVVNRDAERLLDVEDDIHHARGVDVEFLRQRRGFRQRTAIGAAAFVSLQDFQYALQYLSPVHHASHFLKTMHALTSPKPKLTFSAVDNLAGVQTAGTRSRMLFSCS